VEREARRSQATQAALQSLQAPKVETKAAPSFGASFGFGAAQAKSPATATAFGPSSSVGTLVPSSSHPSGAATATGGRERRKPWLQSKGIAPKTKAWADGDPSRPRFTDDWEVEYFDTLQWTDVKTNHNKYYCLELHIGKEKGRQVVRLYTHYGRTDDLVKNPKAGRRENRFYATLELAEDAYAALIEEKTLAKGYRKVDLVHSNIGSEKLRALISELAGAKASEQKPKLPGDAFVDLTPLSSPVSDLVRYIYDEASAALNNTLGPAKITSLGIETPLGVVGMSQIEKGEAILQRLYEMFKLGTHDDDAINELTNQFYTVIPHNLGRARAQIGATRLNSMGAFEEKQDLLQLMRDMLNVTADGKSLGATDIDMKYRALRSKIEVLSPDADSEKFEHVKRLIMREHPLSDSNANEGLIDIKHVYAIHRPAEHAAFNAQRVQSNQQTLFHGSRISNYVGLLSRGLMMPKMVVAMGGKRRDGGLLGNGIYFGDSAATSAQYCSPGSKGTRLMLLNNVALGSVKDYEQVVFGLMEPPQGYNSVHGVRNVPGHRTDFKDDEYVIFNPTQQYQQYLVEFTLKKELDEFVTSQVFHNADGTTSIQLKNASTATVSATPAPSAVPETSTPDNIASTVDAIFANLGSSAAPSTSTTTTSSRLGGSYKSKFSTATGTSSTFTTPFSTMLTSGTSLQTSLLKPSGLQTSSSGSLSGGLKLQPSGLDTTSSLLSGSLKLQPSGLTTSVKVAPLGSSFGRKSSGSSDPYADAPSNVLKLDLDPTLQTSTASGAAAILQTTTSGAQELSEEEKALKRAAMKMGGKNFGSRLREPAASSSAQTATAASSYDTDAYSADAYSTPSFLPKIEQNTSGGTYAVAKTLTSSKSPYAGDSDAYTFETETTKLAPAPLPRSISPSDIQLSKPSSRKKRTLNEVAGSNDATSVDAEAPKAKHNLGTSKLSATATHKTAYSTGVKNPLSATSSGFGSASNWTSSYKATLTTAPLSASVLGTSSAKPTFGLGSSALGASFGLGASGLNLGVSISGLASSSSSALSGSSTSVPSLRTTFSNSTTQVKLATLLPKDLLKERLAESKLRGLYATERTNVLLKDTAYLMDLFKNREQMRNTLETSEEMKMPKILTRHRLASPVINSEERHGFGLRHDPLTQSDYCIVDLDQFKKNFALLTGNLLGSLTDLKNIVFVGDLVVGALYRTPEGNHAGSDVHFANQFRDADIEIAIVGLDGAAAMKRVSDIYFAAQSATKATCEIIRTKTEIIILGQYPVRNIRIPLRFFKGPAEAVFARDVDCTCVGFDGSTVWALPRAQRALTKRYNLADFELRHVTYEVNLYRWAKRGFAVCVPGFQSHLVTPHLFKQLPWQVTGLAKLLLFEEEMNAKYVTPAAPGVTLTYEPWMPLHQRYAIYTRDEFSMMRIHDFQAKQKFTYPHVKEEIDNLEFDAHSNIFVPWGPQWRNSRVLKHLQYANAQYYRTTAGIEGGSRHLIYFGLENVTKGYEGLPVSEPGLLKETSPKSKRKVPKEDPVPVPALEYAAVKGNAEFEPVTAATNNFFVVSHLDWYSEAYCIEGSAVELTHALTNYAFANDAEQLSKLIRKSVRQGADVTKPSSFQNGRSALFYACSNGMSDTISLLISKGASPVAVDAASGLSPIHFAAFSAEASAVETLLRHPLVDINAKTVDQRWTPLHFACYYGNLAVLEVLLHDTKIRLNPRDFSGRTPVFLAAYAGHLKCLELLKAAGAKMDTRAPAKDLSGVTALQAAAQRGHEGCRQYLIELLRPEFPPILVPSEESLELMRLSEIDRSSDVQASSETPKDDEAVVTVSPTEISSWSRVDHCGQNILHLAVKHGFEPLVRQILHTTLLAKAPQYPGLDEICMPSELAGYNLINIQASNLYGQNALYYAVHQLDKFVSGKRLEAGDIAGSVEALGLPTSDLTCSLRTIINMLRSAGIRHPELCQHRSLPVEEDAELLAYLKKKAREAQQTVRRAENAKAKREAELQAEERAARPMARTPVRRKKSNDPQPLAGRNSPLSASRSRPHHHDPDAYAAAVSFGAGFDYGSPSASTATLADFASANDTAELLATISQMHQAKQLDDGQKMALKLMALRKERSLYAALKAFQHDRFSLVFTQSLQMIARIKPAMAH